MATTSVGSSAPEPSRSLDDALKLLASCGPQPSAAAADDDDDWEYEYIFVEGAGADLAGKEVILKVRAHNALGWWHRGLSLPLGRRIF